MSITVTSSSPMLSTASNGLGQSVATTNMPKHVDAPTYPRVTVTGGRLVQDR